MRKSDLNALARDLGASRVEPIPARRSKTPLGLLWLQQEIVTRLRSTGGRPSDPSWTVTRQVPFKEETWSHLQEAVEELGASRPRVGPAQIAAILVEQGLQDLRSHGLPTGEWTLLLRASRSAGLFCASDAADLMGSTRRQLDAWVGSGRLRVSGRRGRRRAFDADEIVRGQLLKHVLQLSKQARSVERTIRDLDLSRRYVFVRVSNGSVVLAVADTVDEALEEAAFVFDQVSVRRRVIAKGVESAPPQEERSEPEEAEEGLRRTPAVRSSSKWS